MGHPPAKPLRRCPRPDRHLRMPRRGLPGECLRVQAGTGTRCKKIDEQSFHGWIPRSEENGTSSSTQPVYGCQLKGLAHLLGWELGELTKGVVLPLETSNKVSWVRGWPARCYEPVGQFVQRSYVPICKTMPIPESAPAAFRLARYKSSNSRIADR